MYHYFSLLAWRETLLEMTVPYDDPVLFDPIEGYSRSLVPIMKCNTDLLCVDARTGSVYAYAYAPAFKRVSDNIFAFFGQLATTKRKQEQRSLW